MSATKPYSRRELTGHRPSGLKVWRRQVIRELVLQAVRGRTPLRPALEPVLDDHIARLTEPVHKGDEAAVTDTSFDFRWVDFAMGSGHFLVAAVGLIEARLSTFVALHP